MRCRSWLLINKFNARRSGYELERTFTKFVEITQCNGHYAVQGHSRSPILVPIESSYTTSIRINSDLPPILHRFWDIALERSKIAIFWLPLLRLTPDGGVSLGRSPSNFYRKVRDGQGTKWRRNIAESFNRLSRVHERCRQTTDRRTGDDI